MHWKIIGYGGWEPIGADIVISHQRDVNRVVKVEQPKKYKKRLIFLLDILF